MKIKRKYLDLLASAAFVGSILVLLTILNYIGTNLWKSYFYTIQRARNWAPKIFRAYRQPIPRYWSMGSHTRLLNNHGSWIKTSITCKSFWQKATDMPYGPPSPCTYPGCNKLVQRGSRCADHPYDKKPHGRNPDIDKLYNSNRWRMGRLHFLTRNPLCVECSKNGRAEPAKVVDHIQPHKGDSELFYNSQNWQALCKPCHDRKTATKDGAFGNYGWGIVNFLMVKKWNL